MSSENSSPNLRVILTGPENFSHWKLRIPGILGREKVLGVVTGTDPMPETPTEPAPSVVTGTDGTAQVIPAKSDEKATLLLNAWRERDQKAQGVIMDTISDQIGFRLEEENLAPLAENTTSKKMFDKL